MTEEAALLREILDRLNSLCAMGAITAACVGMYFLFQCFYALLTWASEVFWTRGK